VELILSLHLCLLLSRWLVIISILLVGSNERVLMPKKVGGVSLQLELKITLFRESQNSCKTAHHEKAEGCVVCGGGALVVKTALPTHTPPTPLEHVHIFWWSAVFSPAGSVASYCYLYAIDAL
jgi:hypothetical protein